MPAVTVANRDRIIALAIRYRLLTMFGDCARDREPSSVSVVAASSRACRASTSCCIRTRLKMRMPSPAKRRRRPKRVRRRRIDCGDFRLDPAEPKLGQIEFVNEHINDANRIVLTDPIFQCFRKQRALTAILPQRSASSGPPAYRVRILARESNPATRFYTARVVRAVLGMSARCPLFTSSRPNSGHRWMSEKCQ